MVMCMLVIVGPPIVMSVWWMAFLLGQHVEYYYYYYAIGVSVSSLHRESTESLIHGSGP